MIAPGRPDLAPDLAGEPGEGKHVVAGGVEVFGNGGERRFDRGHESGVSVGDDQADPRQAADGQQPQELQPAGPRSSW